MTGLNVFVTDVPFSHLIIRLEPITLNIEEMKKEIINGNK